MVLLTVLSLLLIVSYTIGVCAYTRGIPYSISETYYKIKHKFWFAVATIGTAALLMPAILEVTPESYQFLAFLACVGMILTGAAPNFREGIEKRIHIAGAFMCLVFSQWWAASLYPFLLILWLLYLIYTVIGIKGNWKGNFIQAFILTKPMFFVEITAIVSVYLCIMLSLLYL